MQNFDLVVDTGGGDSFTDIYGLKRLLLVATARRAAQKAKVPLILSPQTIGPFESRIGAVIARRSLKHASWVGSRDSISAEASVRAGRGVDGTFTDLVFAVPPPEASSEPIDVFFNVSGLLWSSDSHGDRTLYQRLVTGALRDLMDRGRSVTLLAHVFNGEEIDSDLRILDEVARAAGGPVEIFRESSLEATRSAIGGAQLLIGSRMHACLNALSVGTPALALAYSRKFGPLLEDLGWSHWIDLNRAPTTGERIVEFALQAERDESGLERVRRNSDSRLSDLSRSIGPWVGVG